MFWGFVFILNLFASQEARAIPTPPGDYIVTGDITGTFTTTAAGLSAWHFTDLLNFQWSHTNPAQNPVTFNDTQKFLSEQLTSDFYRFFAIVWPTDSLSTTITTTTFFTDNLTELPDFNQNAVVHFQFAPVATVPEPTTGSLVALGLLALLGYGWRQRRQAGLQIG